MSEFDTLVQQVHDCALCTLSQKRNRAVPGDGARDAQIVFIGEGPGYYEDQQGLPFVGPAGKLLDELLASIGLRREDVYITNMVKCRPPGNRDPLPAEIRACRPYLDRQIDLIGPRIIVTLGRYSFSKFFSGEPIGKARGKPRRWKGITVYPMYHPAAALRNPTLRLALEEDFGKLRSLLDQAPPDTEESQDHQEEQLSFF